MPYIPFSKRRDLNTRRVPSSSGELNFVFTIAIVKYLNQVGESYTTINEAIGALECAKLELYRRIAVPYEKLKIDENGDVY